MFTRSAGIGIVVTWALFASLAVLSGCGGGSGGSPSLPSTPRAAQPTPGTIPLSSPSPVKSVRITTIRTPDAPTGGIAIGSDGSVYLSGAGTFVKYNGTFKQYAYPLPLNGPLPPGAEPSDNAMTNGPGNEISVVLGSAFPNGPPITYVAALDPVTGRTSASQIITTFAADETIGVADVGHGTIAAMQSYEAGTTGIVTIFNTAFAAVGDLSAPDLSIINTATVGADGEIYSGNLPTFNPMNNTTSPPRILRQNYFTNATTSVTLPSGSQVEHVALGPDGAVWFTDPGLNKIGRVTTSLSVTYYRIPTPQSGPAGITAGSDNAMWFTEAGANKIGRIDASGTVTEYPIPGGTLPLGIAGAPPGAGCIPNTLYFAEAQGLGKVTFTQ
ncbi:MAG: hypothetical protein JO322_09375 [Candidatus Eremiobacteraeota bacterium]|nr:hypothetical protein [Candidatus Eremiobacteraeota bacterium]